MDINSNKYTFSFAILMVVLVAAVLSIAAINLKPFQDKNIELKKKQDILCTIGFSKNASDENYLSREKAGELFSTYIKDQPVINSSSEIINDLIAFDVDMAKELKKDVKERNFPFFVAEKDGETYYIIPIRGKGLWGPIWGFIALAKDLNTVLGATFGHKSETPGLGAEINLPIFQDQFPGKKIFNENGIFNSIKVIKGGAKEGDVHGVDAISGGTITSNGVSDMLYDCLINYVTYFENLKNTALIDSVAIDSLETIELIENTVK